MHDPYIYIFFNGVFLYSIGLFAAAINIATQLQSRSDRANDKLLKTSCLVNLKGEMKPWWFLNVVLFIVMIVTQSHQSVMQDFASWHNFQRLFSFSYSKLLRNQSKFKNNSVPLPIEAKMTTVK